MIPVAIAIVTELGIPFLGFLGLGAVGVTARVKRAKRRNPRCVPTDDGMYFGGRKYSASEIRRDPKLGHHKAFLARNAEGLGLTKGQRRSLGIA